MEEHIKQNDIIINELKTMLVNHMSHEETELTQMLNEVRALREDIAPLLEIWESSNGFYKVFMWGLKVSAITAAGIGAILFIKKL